MREAAPGGEAAVVPGVEWSASEALQVGLEEDGCRNRIDDPFAAPDATGGVLQDLRRLPRGELFVPEDHGMPARPEPGGEILHLRLQIPRATIEPTRKTQDDAGGLLGARPFCEARRQIVETAE